MQYDNNVLLGQMVRNIRKSLNLTQKQMAKTLSVTPQTISAWELGKRAIHHDNARMIFIKFNIPNDEYYKYLDEPAQNSIIKYCSKCGTLFTCPEDKPSICCGSPTLPADKCKALSKGCMVLVKNNHINVSITDEHIKAKYIAYIGYNCTEIAMCNKQHTANAHFQIKEGSNLYVFIERKGLFKIK